MNLDDMQDNHLDNVRDQRPKSVVIDSVVRQPFFENFIQILILDTTESF